MTALHRGRPLRRWLAVGLLGGLIGVGGAEAVDPAPVLTVNGQPASERELSLALGARFSRQAPATREALAAARAQALDDLARQIALAQAAQAMGLADDPDIKGELSYYRSGVLAKAFRERQAAMNPVTPADLDNEYRLGRKTIMEYPLQHILLAQEAQARNVIRRLDAGESFDELARLLSVDRRSSEQGGSLGWIRLEDFPSYPLADAVLALKPGRHGATPLRGEHGWHVVRITEAPRPVRNAPAVTALPKPTQDALRARAASRKLDAAEAKVLAKAAIRRSDTTAQLR